MKFEHYPDLGAAIPRKSKLGLLIFNHAFFIGESTTMGTQVVICSQQYTGPEGYKRTWFKVVRPGHYT